MYTAYFGLNENPFSIAPDPLYLYMSEHHREALAHLKYGIRHDGGFVLLTGEVGAGKTTLCRSLLEQLPDDVNVAYVLNPRVSVIELLETICDELHIVRPAQGSIKTLVDLINSFLLEANARGRRTVLIIDEAQNLAIDVLEQLRLLTNLETNRYKLLQIVLLGQPELLQILNRQDMRQLSQRVTARYHLGPLDVDDLDAYLRHRLNIAGCQSQLFPASLAKTLWAQTGGVPRLINLVCDRALLGAYVLERKEVDRAILLQAAREVLGQTPRRRSRPGVVAAAVGALLLLVGGGWLWSFSPPTEAVLGIAPAQVPVESALAGGSVQTLAALPANPAESLGRSWPAGFAASQSMTSAFADLAGLWGLDYPAEQPDPCSYAVENGLSCLLRKGGLDALRQMNLPAILTLYDDNGAPFHVVMTELDGERVRLTAGEESHDLAAVALTARWFGEYLLLWQKPPLRREFLQPGEAGDAVDWLAQTLEELGLYAVTGQEVRLESSLLGAFKAFQLNNDLTPDGVLGSLSLVHLTTARNLDGPRLYSRGAR